MSKSSSSLCGPEHLCRSCVRAHSVLHGAGCPAFLYRYHRVSITASRHMLHPHLLCFTYGPVGYIAHSMLIFPAAVSFLLPFRSTCKKSDSDKACGPKLLDSVFPGGLSYPGAGSGLREFFWLFPASPFFGPPLVVLDALLHVTGIGTLRTAGKVSARWGHC